MNLVEAEKLSPVEVVYKNDYGGYGSYGDTHITINASEDEITQTVALLHEIGHAVHHKNKCRCYTQKPRNVFLREYHAFKYTMKYVMGDLKLMGRFVSLVTKVLGYDNWPDHQAAIQQLMKLKQWKKLYKIVGTKNA